jgi:hypothetical protein
VRVVETPETITVINEAGKTAVTGLSVRAGGSVDFTASCSINHTAILSEDTDYSWGVTGNIGTIDANGKFTAADVTADGNITVTAGGKTVAIPIKTYQTGSFDDVRTTSWYYDAVEYVNGQGLITGTGTRQFSPGANISRAMMATVLWRMAGKPAAAGTAAGFSDVASGSWYSEAVAWAQSTGVVTGYSDGTFNPTGDINREQMAAMLYRYETLKNGAPASSGSLAAYTDAGKVSSWAKDAMTWCVTNGIITGTTDTAVSPKTTATRAQCAAIIQRYMTK